MRFTHVKTHNTYRKTLQGKEAVTRRIHKQKPSGAPRTWGRMSATDTVGGNVKRPRGRPKGVSKRLKPTQPEDQASDLESVDEEEAEPARVNIFETTTIDGSKQRSSAKNVRKLVASLKRNKRPRQEVIRRSTKKRVPELPESAAPTKKPKKKRPKLVEASTQTDEAVFREIRTIFFDEEEDDENIPEEEKFMRLVSMGGQPHVLQPLTGLDALSPGRRGALPEFSPSDDSSPPTPVLEMNETSFREPDAYKQTDDVVNLIDLAPLHTPERPESSEPKFSLVTKPSSEMTKMPNVRRYSITMHPTGYEGKQPIFARRLSDMFATIRTNHLCWNTAFAAN